MRRRLVVSVSGGKTSAYMAFMLWTMYRHLYEMVFIFANTGEEREETLEFLRMMAKYWGINIVWVEAVVHHGIEKASTHKVVTFETASRNGEPFREVCKKYGIPNSEFPHCTRELKGNPIRSYIESELGWKRGTYRIAIGIRGDEPRRNTYDKTGERVYVLAQKSTLFHQAEFAELFTTKPDVNDFFEEQPFTLNLQEKDGNCKTCYKKNTTKLVSIAIETPEAFSFTDEMEEKYSMRVRENSKGTIPPPYYFYRGNMSTKSLLKLAAMSRVSPIPPDPDMNSGCTESCEAFGA
jgi:hypothetical protein